MTEVNQGRKRLWFAIDNTAGEHIGSLILSSNMPKQLAFWKPVTLDEMREVLSIADDFYVDDFSKCGVDKRCNCG